MQEEEEFVMTVIPEVEQAEQMEVEIIEGMIVPDTTTTTTYTTTTTTTTATAMATTTTTHMRRFTAR